MAGGAGLAGEGLHRFGGLGHGAVLEVAHPEHHLPPLVRQQTDPAVELLPGGHQSLEQRLDALRFLGEFRTRVTRVLAQARRTPAE